MSHPSTIVRRTEQRLPDIRMPPDLGASVLTLEDTSVWSLLLVAYPSASVACRPLVRFPLTTSRRPLRAPVRRPEEDHSDELTAAPPAAVSSPAPTTSRPVVALAYCLDLPPFLASGRGSVTGRRGAGRHEVVLRGVVVVQCASSMLLRARICSSVAGK
jgi:hypothetical protein